MARGPVIVWFRQVMRLADHPALLAAVATGHPVIPVYILDDEAPGQWRLGGARRWWLHHSIAALDQALRDRGSRLLLRRGSTIDHLRDLARQLNASAVYATRSLEPWARTLEANAQAALAADGVELKRFPGASLFDPDDVRSKSGRPFGLYAPFRRSIADRDVPAPLSAPDAIRSLAHLPGGDKLEHWQLLPRTPDWAGGLRETWVPGEEAAAAQLESFLQNGIEAYHELRDRPDLQGTSRLSPYLVNGELSLRTCWHAACVREGGMGVEAFLRELAWREYSCHLLFHWPAIPEEPFRSEYSEFPWNDDRAALLAWQRGRTGYPMVDAGMRQLWHTGWMHNRVRMITASFLIKHLLLPWQAGETWFWDTLVDADLASNAVNWQWVAGSGADAAPYFRIFNPVKQGETHDPNGDYVRRWVPELAKLPAAHIHAPWQGPDRELERAGVILGKTYPRPLVDHAAARARALAAFENMRAGGS
jgi:deoxyribodipyrimidine photo-lyase